MIKSLSREALFFLGRFRLVSLGFDSFWTGTVRCGRV